MDEIGRTYLILALNLNRHLDGFVDAYFGPPQLKAEAESGEPRPMPALADDARQLQTAIEASDYDLQRRDFLTRQVRAMSAAIHKLSGNWLGFREEVQLYFDITPEKVDEAVFEAAHAEIDRLLPGQGSLIDRMDAWKEGLELRPDRILPTFELACRETRSRTVALFDLPPGEELSLQLVEDRPWSAYNWYLGDYRSRIELNTDLSLHVSSAVPLLAHEAYAGHHTEHAIKEHVLYREAGRAEHAIQLLLAAECVLSEGLADSAKGVIFDRAELALFLHDELYPEAGITTVDVETQLRLERAAEALRAVDGNAALLLHCDGIPADEVQQYIERYRLCRPKEAAHTLGFLQNPLFRSYVFNYVVGKALLDPLLEGPDAVTSFRRLLREPFTPTQIRHWLAERV
jgi:hypothetical protein